MKSNQLIEDNLAIDKLLNDSISFLEKGYLANKENFEIEPVSEEISSLAYQTGIRMLHLTKITYEEKENILEKLSNVLLALYSDNTSTFIILDSDGKKCDFYLGVKDENHVTQSFSTLKSSLNGNFPGLEYNEEIETKEIEDLMENLVDTDICEISVATGIPTMKLENRENFVQGIEKVIDGMQGKSFSAIFIANPIGYENIKGIKKAYENLSTQLSPYINYSISLTKGETLNFSKSLGESFTKSYTESLSETESTTTTRGKNLSKGCSKASGGLIVGRIFGSMFGNVNTNDGTSSSEGKTLGKTKGETYGETKGNTETVTEGKTDNSSKTLQLTQKNRSIESLVNKIEKYIERIESAEGSGLWNAGVYFMSKESQNSIVAANIYNGVTRGTDSGIEKSTVCTFRDDNNLEKIKDYLYNFENLMLKVKAGEKLIKATVGSQITNEELALKINLPQKSITGLDVIKMASFGRNKMISRAEGINLGKLYHLGKKYETEIDLDLESLRSHTFITGSTGSGKSNAVYTLLDELYKKDIKFLVIEPTKGEYKNVFGGRENVSVYGTNNKYTELLKINPFSFNEEIHILEHIDRLIEIFSACWPLYAAMPAILKEAIEVSYKMFGWDLMESINLFGEKKYPTIKDLKIALNIVINRSSYSEETKSNYIGSLVTRVNSLSTGLVGNIFVEDELSPEKLFDENVIIDISRVASVETKSLIMGLMFIKLQEHRMSTQKDGNEKLKHITVLEEAHHLLKNTISSSGVEGNNLQGKSIEMLTNAIAEMRTYGQGFIIVDQAPELLDSSAIRNTNTKICLRLPSLSDREIVGHSMNLTDDQIEELAKLEVGVAAVSQRGQEEANLVKLNYMSKKDEYKYEAKTSEKDSSNKMAVKILLNEKLPENEKINNVEVDIREKIEKLTPKEIDRKVYEMLDGDKILDIVNAQIVVNNISEWYNRIEKLVTYLLDLDNQEKILKLEIINSILREATLKEPHNIDFYNEWCEFIRRGGLL